MQKLGMDQHDPNFADPVGPSLDMLGADPNKETGLGAHPGGHQRGQFPRETVRPCRQVWNPEPGALRQPEMATGVRP